MTDENMIENEKQDEGVNEGKIVYGMDGGYPKVKWEPVAYLDPYEDAPEKVRLFHESYVEMWLKDKKR